MMRGERKVGRVKNKVRRKGKYYRGKGRGGVGTIAHSVLTVHGTRLHN